jgi:hypothetical protein
MSIHAALASQPTWMPMTVDRYAALQRATGGRVWSQGDIWWQQVRPFFYRPVLPFESYDTKYVQKLSKFVVFQHATKEGQSNNSYLNPIVFNEVKKYEISKISENPRRIIHRASKVGMKIHKFIDAGEFCEQAFPVYLSFYERTKYSYGTHRRRKEGFLQWARSIFQFPEAVILGVQIGGDLLGFEISCLVDQTLIIDTVIHSDKGLKCGSSDWALHHIRLSAREQGGIEQIYHSMFTKNSGINEFKVRRGARIMALPAYLHLHPLWLATVGTFSKEVRRQLQGLNQDQVLRINKVLASGCDLA